MNGVLIDDEELHRQAFQDVLRQTSPQMTDKDYVRYFVGRTDRAGFQGFFSDRCPDRLGEIEELLDRKLELYLHLAASSLRSYPGATELVNGLHQAGHDLAVVTSSTRHEVAVVLDFLNLNDAFTTVVTAEDARNGKPSPAPYLTGATRLDRAPHECLVIEDSPSGITSAKAAGMTCAAIASTHDREHLTDADVIVERISDLTACSIFHRPRSQ